MATSEQRLGRSEEWFMQISGRVPFRGHHCEGPPVGRCLACPWNSKHDRVGRVG